MEPHAACEIKQKLSRSGKEEVNSNLGKGSISEWNPEEGGASQGCTPRGETAPAGKEDQPKPHTKSCVIEIYALSY